MEITLAENLKKLRSLEGLTQKELAKALGVSFQAISRWECGIGYPDISILPTIASFFCVTLDELLRMDEILSEKRLHETHRRWEENNKSGFNNENIKLLRDALKSFPNDFLLLTELAVSLEKSASESPDGYKKLLEATAISERTLKYCSDCDIVNAVRANVCSLYRKIGNNEKAVERAMKLPAIVKSREVTLANFLSGEQKIRLGQETIQTAAWLFAFTVRNMIKTPRYSPNEKIQLLAKSNEIYEVMFGESSFPSGKYQTSANFRLMAEAALSVGWNEKALGFLSSAAERAIACASYDSAETVSDMLTDMLDGEVAAYYATNPVAASPKVLLAAMRNEDIMTLFAKIRDSKKSSLN